jgi:hypothetical protein
MNDGRVRIYITILGKLPAGQAKNDCFYDPGTSIRVGFQIAALWRNERPHLRGVRRDRQPAHEVLEPQLTRKVALF